MSELTLFLCICIEYVQIVVTNGNSRILDIEIHSNPVPGLSLALGQ